MYCFSDDDEVGFIQEDEKSYIFVPLDLHLKVKMVACGKEHTLLLSGIGVVLSMGSSR